MRDAWTRGLVGLKAGFLALLTVAAMASFALESDVHARLTEAQAKWRAEDEAEAHRRDIARQVDVALLRANEVETRLEDGARERHYLLAALSRRDR